MSHGLREGESLKVLPNKNARLPKQTGFLLQCCVHLPVTATTMAATATAVESSATAEATATESAETAATAAESASAAERTAAKCPPARRATRSASAQGIGQPVSL